MTLEIAYDAADPVTNGQMTQQIVAALNKLPYITARQLTEADIAQSGRPVAGQAPTIWRNCLCRP
jgi:hypothetical protein